MRRARIYLDESQEGALAKRVGTSGVSRSTLIREAIDAFQAGPNTGDVLLGRFPAALEEVEL